MSSTVISSARATESRRQQSRMRGVRDPLETRSRPHSAAAPSAADTCRSFAECRCPGSTNFRHGTTRFLQMKDPDVMYPSLFSEDSTTSTEEKVKIMKKTKKVLRATRRDANRLRRNAVAARQTDTTSHASSAGTPPDTVHAEPAVVESGHQDNSASADQDIHLEVPTQAVLPAPAPTPSQQQTSRSLPGSIIGKLYWVAGALFGALMAFSKHFL